MKKLHNAVAVDVGGVGDLDFECVTKMDDISILLIRSEKITCV